MNPKAELSCDAICFPIFCRIKILFVFLRPVPLLESERVKPLKFCVLLRVTKKAANDLCT